MRRGIDNKTKRTYKRKVVRRETDPLAVFCFGFFELTVFSFVTDTVCFNKIMDGIKVPFGIT